MISFHCTQCDTFVRVNRRRLVGLAIGVAGLAVLGLLAILWPRHGAPAVSSSTSVENVSAEEQVKAVAAELQRRNAEFDGLVLHTAEGDVVTSLSFAADNVHDLTPVAALKELRVLKCSAINPRECQLADLSPLRGLKLKELNCSFTKVKDLSPLEDMKLETLTCSGTELSDLRPLRGMPLRRLNIDLTKVENLAPVKDLPTLTALNISLTPARDLSVLKGTKLEEFEFFGTFPFDVSPLRTLPLKKVSLDFRSERDTEILQSLKTLEQINNKSVEEFWKDVAAKKDNP